MIYLLTLSINIIFLKNKNKKRKWLIPQNKKNYPMYKKTILSFIAKGHGIGHLAGRGWQEPGSLQGKFFSASPLKF